MTSKTLPPNLLALVDGRVLTAGEAWCVGRYAADVLDLREAEARTGSRKRLAGVASPGFVQTVESAKKRVRDADGWLGEDQRRVVHDVGFLGKSLAEAAVDLGWDHQVARLMLTHGARKLLRVYGELSEVA